MNARGEPVRSAAHLSRIERLRIPPAWTNVCISSSFHSDLQATGIDAAGRKQYIYHPEFVARQADRKFRKLGLFAATLPGMRQTTSEHIELLHGPVQPRVMAVMVRLINEAYFRVGSEEYAKRYKTYGITTLLKRHVRLDGGGTVLFRYTGKKGVKQRHVVTDELVYEVLQDLMALPGSRLFQYYDDLSILHYVHGHMLNGYIRRVMSPGISAKDFRTWAGTLLAAETLTEMGAPQSDRQAKKNITEAVKVVAESLGNTPAVARSSYISPVVFERYTEGRTLEGYVGREQQRIRARQAGYEPEELALVKLLGLRVKLQTESS